MTDVVIFYLYIIKITKKSFKRKYKKNVYVVGNTIIEPCKKILSKISKKN